MDSSIQEVARLTGTTSRALRHYDHVGLLRPSRVGSNGMRFYDAAALLRLQRILLLRELGLGLTEVHRVLEREVDDVAALRRHLAVLRAEQERLARQIASVERTVTAREAGEELMSEQMFDGFDHTVYREEVEQRWGVAAYEESDRWWRGLGEEGRAAWQARQAALQADWRAAAERGVEPGSEEAQQLAARHVAWLADVPGTPGHGGTPVRAYIEGLADMYVADPRFAAHYGGQHGAELVRDALHRYAEQHL